MENRIAVITGATSGIGKEFAFRLAERGYDIIVVGRRRELLNKVAMEITDTYNVNVDVNILDLGNKEELDLFYIKIKELKNIEFLVNNAGSGVDGTFSNDKYENQEKLLKVHVDASTKLSHAVIPEMKRRRTGNIINLGSLAGFNVFPDSLMYCATKSYLISMSQCLAMELINYNIKVQVLCPGFTKTDFHSKLNMKVEDIQKKGILKWGTAEKVVEVSLKALKKKLKVIVIPGFMNKVVYCIVKFIPKSIYYKFAIKGWKLLD